ncbi:MAG: hypothetical protein HKM07_00030 [Chlamydiae bacterium]|nr:hypothetical protein [Chlamydiota bacterium]
MHYLIDGYNLLFQLPELKGASLQVKREKIIEIFQEYLISIPLQITIVFDGNKQSSAEVIKRHINQLEIVYTAKKQTADSYIIEELETSFHPQNFVVVTSDSGLARQSQGLQASTQTIEEFLEYLSGKMRKKAKKEMREKPSEEPQKDMERLRIIFEKRLNKKNKN